MPSVRLAYPRVFGNIGTVTRNRDNPGEVLGFAYDVRNDGNVQGYVHTTIRNLSNGSFSQSPSPPTIVPPGGGVTSIAHSMDVTSLPAGAYSMELEADETAANGSILASIDIQTFTLVIVENAATQLSVVSGSLTII